MATIHSDSKGEPIHPDGMVGEGVAMARRRRQWGKLEKIRMRREREAAWRADTMGREVLRRRQLWLH